MPLLTLAGTRLKRQGYVNVTYRNARGGTRVARVKVRTDADTLDIQPRSGGQKAVLTGIEKAATVKETNVWQLR